MEKPEEIVLRFSELFQVLDEAGVVDRNGENGLLGEKKAAAILFQEMRDGRKDDPSEAKPAPAPSVPPLQLDNVDDATPPAPLKRSASQMPVFAKPPPINVRGKVSLTRLRAVALYEPPPPKPRVLTAWEKEVNPDDLKILIGMKLSQVLLHFKRFDVDQSGQIELSEFINAVRALKIKADDDVVGIVFREYDYDSSGSIEYTEVCRVALRDALKRSWMRVMDLFKKWDRDNSQSVSKFEFRKAIKECGFDAPANEVDKLFDSMDSDGSGQIDFKELNMNMRQGSQIRLAEELQVGAAGEIELDAKNASAVREAGSREKRIETWQESLKSEAQQ